MENKQSAKSLAIFILLAVLALSVLVFLVSLRMHQGKPGIPESANDSTEAPVQSAIVPEATETVGSFEECVAAGNPVMESYPRTCRSGEVTFIEEVASPDAAEGSRLTEAEARAIAEKSCIKGGEALEPGVRNDYTGTWWFDANLNSVREGCHPACVVSDETREAEINWRCTGLIAPQ